MHWSDLEHLIAFIKLKIIYWFFKKRHKIKGKIISLYLVEITIRKLRYRSLNTPHCPKSIPCGAILCCSCIRRLNTKVHASFIRGNKTKPISLPSNTAVAISIWSHQGASALTPTTPHHQHRVRFCTNLSWQSSSWRWMLLYPPGCWRHALKANRNFPPDKITKG